MIPKTEARRHAQAVWLDFLRGHGATRAMAQLADLLSTPLGPEGRFLATVALPNEPDLLPLIAATGSPVYAPVTRDQGRMEFRLLFDAGSQLCPIEPGYRGVPGPHAKSALLSLPLTDADVAFVPCLAAGPQGHRLGRGLGYYDRWRDALAKCRRLALLPEELTAVDFAAEPHDLRLSMAFTENGTVEY